MGHPAPVQEVAVAVIKAWSSMWWSWLLLGVFLTGAVLGAVLPDDRAEAMYHYYEGGGVDVSGPAVLVRRSFEDQVSLSGSYYVDTISSASVDVVTGGSPYTDKRSEYGLGMDYLYGNTTMGLNLGLSEESDYRSESYHLNVSQEFFAGMSTLNLGYSRSDDTVSRNGTDFSAGINRHHFRLGLSQIISPKLMMSLDYEGITDDGYLSNPYRSARILGAAVPERYPGARTSNALALRGVQYLEHGASVALGYRYFEDTWGVRGHTYELEYRQYYRDDWQLGGHYRYYGQSAASFYQDDFDTEYNYMARDKELSSFNDQSLGFSITDGRFGFSYDYVMYDYKNFSDLRLGKSGLYSFNSNVLQMSYAMKF